MVARSTLGFVFMHTLPLHLQETSKSPLAWRQYIELWVYMWWSSHQHISQPMPFAKDYGSEIDLHPLRVYRPLSESRAFHNHGKSITDLRQTYHPRMAINLYLEAKMEAKTRLHLQRYPKRILKQQWLSLPAAIPPSFGIITPRPLLTPWFLCIIRLWLINTSRSRGSLSQEILFSCRYLVTGEGHWDGVGY